MNITFVSADDTIRMTFGIDPWSAVKDLTKIEKELGKDLTDIIQKAIDVAFNVTSQTFTRGPKSAYVLSYSWTLYPVYEGRVVENNAVKSISVTVGDSDHNLYEFEDVEDRDVDAMITWLRKEHDIFYAPPKVKEYEGKIEPLSSTFLCCDSKLVTETQRLHEENKKLKKKVAEQQKKIDSYEATLSKITDIMEHKYAGPAWSETWDDLVDRIKRMKEKVETIEALEAAKTYWRDSFTKAQDSRSAFCKKLKEELNVKMEKDILAEIKRLKTEHDDARGLSLKIEELEDRFDKICEELDTSERDFATVIDELRKKLNELDKLAEFKAKLAEVIKLPEDKKDAATTEDYISSFEHTKKEWRKMEIKLENYEREIRLLNAFLEEKKKELGASNGAMDVLRNLHGSIIGLCDIDDCPQIIGARIIDKLDRVKKEKEDLKTDYTNAKCARAELRYLYSNIVGIAARDDMSMHELSVGIHSKYKHTFHNGARYCDRMRELEKKLEDIRDICDGNSDVMNIIG